MRRTLLAKSRKDNIDTTVLAHTEDVVESAVALFGTAGKSTRLGRKFAKMFGVEVVDRFITNVVAAAALHDIGKINESFQLAIDAANQRKLFSQLIRHEHVSAILLLSYFGDPLRESDHHDWQAIFSAVVGHHRKTDFELRFTQDDLLALNTELPQCEALVNFINRVTGLEFDSTRIPESISALDIKDVIEDDVCDLLGDLDDLTVDTDPDDFRMTVAVRAALLIADSAGSALPRQKQTPSSWISECFSEDNLIGKLDVEIEVIQPRIAQIESRYNSTFEWSDFQDATAMLPSRALLLAPCGSGKTLAAWRWIAEQAQEKIRHAIFLYPTRATATEGFKDYVAWAPEARATLMHGSAAFELESLLENPPDPDERWKRDFSVDSALYSMSFWKKQFFSATVDQFLSFVKWNYDSLCLLPVLADAVVVVDEVHSFDDQMFDSLVDFLERTNVPVLCMTATLTGPRRDRLEKHMRRPVTVLDAYQKHFPKLRDVDDQPRYEVSTIEADDALEIATDSFADGKKVLWVVNTVARAQQLFREIEAANAVPAERLFCYHSRFRLNDRKSRHDSVIAAFQKNNVNSAIAITTQVCEMGLDLDADVLITEECPAASLVQRMGRCNRAASARQGSGKIFVYKPESPLPYKEEVDLVGLPELLERMMENDRFSQRSLNRWLHEVPQLKEQSANLSSFFECGFIRVGDFRDIEDRTRQAILDDDLEEVVQLLKGKKPIDGYVVSVPRYPDSDLIEPERPIPRWLRIAKRKNYCESVGYVTPAPDANAENEKEEPQWLIV